VSDLLKLKEKKRKGIMKMNIDLAVLPSHNIVEVWVLVIISDVEVPSYDYCISDIPNIVML